MTLPDFGFTRRDKILLGLVALVLAVLTVSFIVFLNIKVDKITKLPEITPRPKFSIPVSTNSATNNIPTMTQFYDNEYGFSFSYPKKLGLRKISNPAQKAYEYANKYYKTNFSATASVLTQSTPSPEKFNIINKQYAIVSTDNPTTDLIAVSVIKGDYEKVKENNKGFADNLGSVQENTAIPSFYSFYNIKTSTSEGSVLVLPTGNNLPYFLAIYPLDKEHFLQIEIQPEFYAFYKKNDNIVNTILQSVKI